MHAGRQVADSGLDASWAGSRPSGWLNCSNCRVQMQILHLVRLNGRSAVAFARTTVAPAKFRRFGHTHAFVNREGAKDALDNLRNPVGPLGVGNADGLHRLRADPYPAGSGGGHPVNSTRSGAQTYELVRGLRDIDRPRGELNNMPLTNIVHALINTRAHSTNARS